MWRGLTEETLQFKKIQVENNCNLTRFDFSEDDILYCYANCIHKAFAVVSFIEEP